MTFLLILAAGAILSIAITVNSVLHDGRSPRPPRSHHVDPDFVAPGARATYHRAA